MLPLDGLKMFPQALLDCSRKHRIPIFVAFAGANDNIVTFLPELGVLKQGKFIRRTVFAD